MKLCKDCKHCGYNTPFGKYFTLSTVPCCRMPPVKKICLVTGNEVVVSQLYCWMEREADINNDCCGADGQYFEQYLDPNS